MDALERDFYEERRRKWRRSAFWRGFLVAAVLALVVGVVLGAGAVQSQRDHVARFTVGGLITDDLERDLLLRRLAEADHARAVIVRINSPGGTTAGSEALYEALRDVAGEKPVVAVMSEAAASGGYIAALAADHIVARGNTLTGSIGVIMEYPDLTGVLDTLGIELETVRSSPLKAEPSPFRETNPAARALDEAMVAESYAWFRGLVGERRGLASADLDRVATGAVFSGRQAMDLDLVDALGGEPEALDWLESEDSTLDGLPVVDWEVDDETPLLGALLGSLAGRIGSSSGILGEIARWQGAKLYSIVP